MSDNDNSEDEFVNNADFDDEYNPEFDPDPDYQYKRDNNFMLTSDEENEIINFDPFDGDYWNLYSFNKWNPEKPRKQSDINKVTSIYLIDDFIINKPKLKKALNTLTNLQSIVLSGLHDNRFRRIPDEQLFNLIDLDNLPNLRYLAINNNRYSSDGIPNTKPFDRLKETINRIRGIGLTPEGTANLLYNLRTKESGTSLPYDLIPDTMGFIHYGKHVPQTISQKRDNISSSLGGRRTRRTRKSKKTRKRNSSKRRRYKH